MVQAQAGQDGGFVVEHDVVFNKHTPHGFINVGIAGAVEPIWVFSGCAAAQIADHKAGRVHIMQFLVFVICAYGEVLLNFVTRNRNAGFGVHVDVFQSGGTAGDVAVLVFVERAFPAAKQTFIDTVVVGFVVLDVRLGAEFIVIAQMGEGKGGAGHGVGVAVDEFYIILICGRAFAVLLVACKNICLFAPAQFQIKVVGLVGIP